MKYLCLVYAEEAKLDALPQREVDALIDEVMASNEELAASGTWSWPRRWSTSRRPPPCVGRTPAVGDGRALRRDHRAARWVRAHRGQGPERGNPGRRAIPSARIGSIEVRPVVDLARERSAPEPGRPGRAARADRPAVPRPVAPGPGHPDPPAGRLRLAEEALQDAFTAATEQWPRGGLPANPRAWLVSAGRFKAIERLRRRARFDAALGELAARLDDRATDPPSRRNQPVEDDRLRLIFVCCHPPCRPTPRWP